VNIIFVAKEYGSDISSRFRASQLREEAVRFAVAGDFVELDFAGVRTISESFADELFGVLVEERGEEWFRARVKVINIATLPRTTVLEAVARRLQEPA
jgi:hypothetical protein